MHDDCGTQPTVGLPTTAALDPLEFHKPASQNPKHHRLHWLDKAMQAVIPPQQQQPRRKANKMQNAMEPQRQVWPNSAKSWRASQSTGVTHCPNMPQKLDQRVPLKLQSGDIRQSQRLKYSFAAILRNDNRNTHNSQYVP